jgi:hypothetical protein
MPTVPDPRLFMKFREESETAGRARLGLTTYGTVGDRAELEAFQEHDVDRGIYYISSDGRDEALRDLHQLARFVQM